MPFGKHLRNGRFEASEKFVSEFLPMQDISDKVNLSVSSHFSDSYCKLFDGLESYQIYNVTNTDLLWKSMPTNTWAHSHDKQLLVNSLDKRHLSVLVGANADGTHRLKPLMLGQNHSRQLNDCTTFLPVVYKANCDSCLTKEIFKEWFHEQFVPEVRLFQQERLHIHHDAVKAVLLVEDFFHPVGDIFQSDDGKICVKIVPFSAAGLTQPMDKGVIPSCKRLYRMKQLNQCLPFNLSKDCIGDEMQKKMLPFQSYTLKTALCTWMESWREVKKTTLCNAWKQLLREDEVDDVDWTGIELEDYMAVLECSGESIVDEENVLQWLDIDRERSEIQTETENVNTVAFATKENISEQSVQEEIYPVNHSTSIMISDAIDSLNLLLIFTDQNESLKLHQYYLQFWECRNILIAGQKKKILQDGIDGYLNSEEIDLPFHPSVTSSKETCSASDLLEQTTWEIDSTDMFSEQCIPELPLGSCQPSNIETMEFQEEESLKISVDEVNKTYEGNETEEKIISVDDLNKTYDGNETEEQIASNSSSPLFYSIDTEKMMLQDLLLTVDNSIAIGPTVEELGSTQDPLDGACDDSSEATSRILNYDASAATPIELVGIKEESEEVDIIKVEPSLWDGPGASNGSETICKSNLDNTGKRGGCATSEEVMAGQPVTQKGCGIDARTRRSCATSEEVTAGQPIAQKGCGIAARTRGSCATSEEVTADQLVAQKGCGIDTVSQSPTLPWSSSGHNKKCRNYSPKKGCSLKLKVNAQEPNEKEQHACPQCSYKTSYKFLLDRHICTHNKTPLSKKLYACDLCDHRCSTKSDLRKHIIVHEPKREKPFACPHCEYRSDRKNGYQRHLRTHLAVRKKAFVCSICPYKTDVKASLQKHIRIHDNERTLPYACPHCAYKTDINSRLTRHILSHDSNRSKPFACQYCTFRTHDKRNLRVHLVLHSSMERDKQKKITCQYCSYSTHRKGSLNQHMRIHQDKFLACQHCSFRTRHKQSLEVHIRRRHKI